MLFPRTRYVHFAAACVVDVAMLKMFGINEDRVRERERAMVKKKPTRRQTKRVVSNHKWAVLLSLRTLYELC